MFLVDFSDFAVDGIFQGDWIQSAESFTEVFPVFFGQVRIAYEALVGCRRFVEGADGFGTDETFANEFDGGFEEIMKEGELVFIEIIEKSGDGRFVKAGAAEEPADMG